MTRADTSDRAVRKGIFKKVAFEYKSEGSLGASHMISWRNNIPERENSRCKGPEAGGAWLEDIRRKPLWPESTGGLKRSDQKKERERETEVTRARSHGAWEPL